jgi:hypothetical protein
MAAATVLDGMPRLTITAPRTTADLRIGRGVWSWLKSHGTPAILSFDGSHVRVSMPFVGARELGIGLDALTAWNVAALRERPLPSLYNAGVRYQREPVCRTNGVEHICEEWLTAHEVAARGWGDCDDLGPWRAAELRLLGEPAQAVPRPSAAGWHIVVRRADGSIDDPSARLGMPTS